MRAAVDDLIRISPDREHSTSSMSWGYWIVSSEQNSIGNFM